MSYFILEIIVSSLISIFPIIAQVHIFISEFSSNMSDSDDDTPQLSAHALAALKEFYAEQQQTDENEQKEDWVS